MRTKWKVGGFVVVLIATFGGAKWNAMVEKQEIAEQEASMEPEISIALSQSREAFGMPMTKAGMIQDYAEFGKVKRFANLYHSAADYYAQPGDPVYAVADGMVYFSGHQEDYGGLVIVNHEHAGLYSLYGHVSAKRWLIEQGVEVRKGELIGYIADTNEGYGIGDIPHLHFSMRLGNPEDYPSSGRENWMTGYTTEHPAFHNFVDPNRFISRSKKYHLSK